MTCPHRFILIVAILSNAEGARVQTFSANGMNTAGHSIRDWTALFMEVDGIATSEIPVAKLVAIYAQLAELWGEGGLSSVVEHLSSNSAKLRPCAQAGFTIGECVAKEATNRKFTLQSEGSPAKLLDPSGTVGLLWTTRIVGLVAEMVGTASTSGVSLRDAGVPAFDHRLAPAFSHSWKDWATVKVVKSAITTGLPHGPSEEQFLDKFGGRQEAHAQMKEFADTVLPLMDCITLEVREHRMDDTTSPPALPPCARLVSMTTPETTEVIPLQPHSSQYFQQQNAIVPQSIQEAAGRCAEESAALITSTAWFDKARVCNSVVGDLYKHWVGEFSDTSETEPSEWAAKDRELLCQPIRDRWFEEGGRWAAVFARAADPETAEHDFEAAWGVAFKTFVCGVTTADDGATPTQQSVQRKPDELVDVTRLFLPDEKEATLEDGATYRCCCRAQLLSNTILCALKDIEGPSQSWFKGGCGSLVQPEHYHSWNTIRDMPKYNGFDYSGQCMVPYKVLPMVLKEDKP